MSLTHATPLEVAQAAQAGSRTLAVLSTDQRNQALTAMHGALAARRADVLAANARDLEAARRAVADGRLSESLVKRLDLGRGSKYDDMLHGILQVRALADPSRSRGCRCARARPVLTLRLAVNRTTEHTLLADDLHLRRVTCPIGTLLVIFEARPEVIANIAALALKSGNGAILKGGKESAHSFAVMATAIADALAATAVPAASLQLVATHDVVDALLRLDQYIDLVVPRGSNALVAHVKRTSTVPVLGHADGICCIYVRADCAADMAAHVLVDAKTAYPAACNAVEQVLVDADALDTVFAFAADALLAHGVTLRCDEPALAALSRKLDPHSAALLQAAAPDDFATEFLDLTLAVKTIAGDGSAAGALDAAIAHINAHSSHHTDAILTADGGAAERFQHAVASASVFWNASTRFADGQRFGLGAEVGISTARVHARGPVGLDGLTTYKWLLEGAGQAAADYGDGGLRAWKHTRFAVDPWTCRDADERVALTAFRAQREQQQQ